MAKLEQALNELFGFEGVYDNNPKDSGGETVFGIARNKHPNLPLWRKIDQLKIIGWGKSEITKTILSSKESFMPEIFSFYKKEFWDVFGCDSLPQFVANEIFEQSVNIGVYHCTRHIQKAVNILNRDQDLWKDIEPDGKPGKNTRDSLIKACEKDSKYVYGILNILQGARYIEIGDENFIRGWMKRTQWGY